MSSPVLKQLGYDARRQRARLNMLGLSEADLPAGARLQVEVIQPGHEALVESFLRWMEEQPETARFLAKADRRRLRLRLRDHLLSLGVDFTSEAYFAGRLEVGLTHVALEVHLPFVLAGYGVLERLLVERILAVPEPRPLLLFLPRIIGLEAALQGDCYRLSQVRHLVNSLAEQMSRTRQFKRQAATDSLTGLASRSFVLQLGEEMLLRSREEGVPLCVAMVDVDHFKQVNDRYGHPAGDAVLKEVANQLRGALRGGDVVGRYGGEEFLILLPGASLESAHPVAERLRQRLGRTPVRHGATTIAVTASLGLAQARPEEALADLVERADQALYRAKQGGRDRVELAR